MARETRRSTTRKSSKQADEEKLEEVTTKVKESTPKRAKKEVETKKEEEEEDEPIFFEEGQEDSDEESDDSDDEAGSSSSEEPPVIEYMVQNRAPRSTAGNKMSALMATASQEDDFYKSAYGGFNEDEADEIYKSPVHSDEDEVDSDFDKPEEEDEPKSDHEEEDKRPKRKKFKEPARGDLLEKNKKWAVARMGGRSAVPANVVDAKTQVERLKEAEHTERVNVDSLQKYEQFELERKKKREKASTARRIPPPYISVRSSQSGNILTVPDVKQFEKPTSTPKYLCAVTGREARYRDPVTGLPYSCSYAFKVIRDKYTKYLKSIKGNPEVDAYLSNFEL